MHILHALITTYTLFNPSHNILDHYTSSPYALLMMSLWWCVPLHSNIYVDSASMRYMPDSVSDGELLQAVFCCSYLKLTKKLFIIWVFAETDWKAFSMFIFGGKTLSSAFSFKKLEFLSLEFEFFKNAPKSLSCFGLMWSKLGERRTWDQGRILERDS